MLHHRTSAHRASQGGSTLQLFCKPSTHLHGSLLGRLYSAARACPHHEEKAGRVFARQKDVLFHGKAMFLAPGLLLSGRKYSLPFRLPPYGGNRLVVGICSTQGRSSVLRSGLTRDLLRAFSKSLGIYFLGFHAYSGGIIRRA